LDIRFEDDRKKGRSPTTRLYLQNQEESDKAPGRSSRARASARTVHEPGVRVEKQEMTSLGRVGLIISGFLFAGMVLFTLSGYERISRAYADINALNDEIESTNLRINELDVQIECAVTIQDAQKVAEAYGMQYPDKSQYVKIGDPLPFSNATTTTTDSGDTTDTGDATDTGTATPDTTTTETTPDPGLDTTGGGEQPSAGG